MKTNRYKHGFTLIELLLALIITGIVASAVATLAYAMNSAGVATDDTSRKQAQVRFATLRISDLIRDCKLICYASASEMAIWTADTNPADGKINIGELTYIESGSSHNHLRLYTFTPPSSATITLDKIDALSTNWWTAYASQAPYTQLIPVCSNVTFNLDDTIKPPNSKIVSIAFNIVENRISSKYQINAALHARAANLYDATSNSIVSDDD